MDYKTEIENLKNSLLAEGFTEDKLNELLDLAAEESLDQAAVYIQENGTDEDIEELTTLLSTEPNTQEEAFEQLNKVFEKAYGSESENKKLESIVNYLKETLEITKQSKDLAKRYQDGDPTAVASVQSTLNDPEVQDIASKIE